MLPVGTVVALTLEDRGDQIPHPEANFASTLIPVVPHQVSQNMIYKPWLRVSRENPTDQTMKVRPCSFPLLMLVKDICDVLWNGPIRGSLVLLLKLVRQRDKESRSRQKRGHSFVQA